jgi:serine/threonine protein kinase
MVVSEANKGKSVRPKLSTSDSSDSKVVAKVEKKHRLKQRFEVIKKLGQGTYGKVQLAINKETGQEVSGRHSIRHTFA